MNWLFTLDAFADTLMPLMPLCVGIYKKAYNKKPLNRVIVLVFTSFIFFGVSNFLADRRINNIWIYNSHGLIEGFMLLTILIGQVRLKSIKKMLWALYTVLFMSYIILLILPGISFSRYSSIIILASVVEMAICLGFYFDILHNKNILNFTKYNLFWIVTSFFIFNIGSIGLEVCYWLYSGKFANFTAKLWTINDILLIAKYSLITFGLLKQDLIRVSIKESNTNILLHTK